MKKYILGIAIAMSYSSVYAQVGINTENPRALLDIQAANTSGIVDGILIPRVSVTRAKEMINAENATLIFVDDLTGYDPNDNSTITSQITREGFYYFNSTQSKWIGVSNSFNGNNFFYMPSVLLPTSATDTRIVDGSNADFTLVDGVYTVNLYNLFADQFLNPIASSETTVTDEENNETTITPSLADFVLVNTLYDYFVTYADTSIFENIKINTNGQLTYTIKANSIIRNGSFMNIVLKVK